MCEKHDRALRALRRYVLEREEFKLSELSGHVYEIAGTTRIAPARDVRDWIEDMVEVGYLKKVGPGVYKREPITL